MKIIVTIVALLLAVASFVHYLYMLSQQAKAKPLQEAKDTAARAAQAVQVNAAPTLGDLSKLIEALAKLSDSLVKAGPAVMSLLASVLFLAIAAASTGIFQGEPPPSSSGNNTSNKGSSQQPANGGNVQPSPKLPPHT